MEVETDSMYKNNVWDLVELLAGYQPIRCKWIFQTKHPTQGEIKRYKDKLVAKGYTLKEGMDYKETFSRVLTKDSLVAYFDLELHQIDVKTTFLNGYLVEKVYMKQSDSFQEKGKEHLVYKLNKSIYSLK